MLINTINMTIVKTKMTRMTIYLVAVIKYHDNITPRNLLKHSRLERDICQGSDRLETWGDVTI